MDAIMITCPACASALNLENIPSGRPIVRCEYCGQTSVLPRFMSKESQETYNRATIYRQNQEFDKALNLLRLLQSDYCNDAELYWSILLCEYGVHYEIDPTTRVAKPTIQSMQRDPINEKPEYKFAIECAESEIARENYFQKMAELRQIQEKYFQIVNNEKTYDIFISFKNTDDRTGDITVDAAIGRKIYNKLTQEGYRVFFSEKTLKDKIGVEYEPYIFAALESSKLMLLICTDTEYINSTWVKNEWKRYYNLKKKDDTKNLTVVYSGIDPKNLPAELRSFQGLNWATTVAEMDLLESVDRIFKGKKSGGMDYDGIKRNMLANIQNELRRGNFENAVAQAGEVILKYDANCWEAFLYRFMAVNRCGRIEELSQKACRFESSDDMQSVFANCKDQKLLEQLQQIGTFVSVRVAEEEKYHAAMNLISTKEYGSLKRGVVLLESVRNDILNYDYIEQNVRSAKKKLNRKRRFIKANIVAVFLGIASLVWAISDLITYGIDFNAGNEDEFDHFLSVGCGIQNVALILLIIGIVLCIWKLGAKYIAIWVCFVFFTAVMANHILALIYVLNGECIYADAIKMIIAYCVI